MSDLGEYPAYVPVDPPDPANYGKWLEILECLCGGMDFEPMVCWLSRFEDIDDALEAARRVRDLP